MLLSLGAPAAQTAEELLAQLRYPEAAAAADAAVKRLEQAKAREKDGTPFAETSKLLNRAMELKTRVAGAGDLSVAQSLNILGAQSYTARDYRGAVAALEGAQSIERTYRRQRHRPHRH